MQYIETLVSQHKEHICSIAFSMIVHFSSFPHVLCLTYFHSCSTLTSFHRTLNVNDSYSVPFLF